MKRSAFWARLLALVLILGLVIGCFAGCSSKVTDKDDDDDDKGSISETKDDDSDGKTKDDDSDGETEGEDPSDETEETAPTASTAIPRPLPTTPSDEVTEPSSEATEPSDEVTAPSTEATVPSTETTVPPTADPDLILSMVGKYWMYSMNVDGTQLDYNLIIEAGYEDSYLLLDDLCTGKMYMTGEDAILLTWDPIAMTISDGIDVLNFEIDGELLTLYADSNILVYALEGSDLLELPEDPADPTDPVTEPTSEPTTEPPVAPTVPAVEYYTLTVHSVDPNWSDLYFWGWNSITEENLSAEWPGEAMKKSGNVYTLQIPTWVDSGVLYANSCGEQTDDMDMDLGGDVWIVVNLTSIIMLDREPTAEELKPETIEPETFTVHAYVDSTLCTWGVPNMWAWNRDTKENLYAEWPGEAMTSEGGGWYTIDLPTTMNSLVISGEGVQTCDFWLNGEAEVWIVCNSGDDAMGYDYRPSGSELLPPVTADTFTVRAKVPTNWENPGCWAWEQGGDNVFAEWPGEAMTLEDGWYTIELPAWANGFLINANSGSIQTGDITLSELSDIWVLVGDSQTTYYDYEPTAEDLAEHGF